MKACQFFFIFLLTQAVVLNAADLDDAILHNEAVNNLWVTKLKEQIYAAPLEEFYYPILNDLRRNQLKEVRWTRQFCNEALMNEEWLIKGDPFVEAVCKEFDTIQAAIAAMPESEDGSSKVEAYVLQEFQSSRDSSRERVKALQIVSLSTCPEWKYVTLLQEKLKKMPPPEKELFVQQERQRIDAIGDAIEKVYGQRCKEDGLYDSLHAIYGWLGKKS